MITYKQLSMCDIFEDCQNIFDSDKPQFLSLLENHIDLDSIIPASFYKNYYASTGRHRKYPLTSMLWALIIQKIFSIPTDSLLLVFLNYSKALREFCGFSKVPDASKITRFKQDFLPDLEILFENLVDLTEPICQAIDSAKADMTIFDSSGIEAYVTENNPKYANRIIKQLKAYASAMGFENNYDPYKAAYHSMPSHAASNKDIKQLYVDGHFCYVYKIGIVTNGLGIVRHLNLYNQSFLAAHPDLIPNKKTDSPDADKSIHDARLLIPTLTDFFKAHPLINPKTFLGDAAFDSAYIYRSLLTGDTFNQSHFEKAYIPLNNRSKIKSEYTVNENGIPCCPNDSSLPMKTDGTKTTHNGVKKYKFVCPKTIWDYNPKTRKSHRKCTCENPCTSSKCGRMIYIYPEQNLRAYPGTLRGTKEWDETYKVRTTVERSINHFKDSFCLAGRKTQNEKTLHADLILSGITQLITVVLADKIHKHQYIRSLKPLLA
ncbi:MAG: transposase [Lachnospiraceae bacterium]|nr:transposase [Lachnospiraceae bacterium]MBR0033997.1 transposase [Bacilli bacterium]